MDQERRSIDSSELHKGMLAKGLVLDRTKSRSVKLNLQFEWETDNFFRYACRMPDNQIAVVYIPKVLWGKRNIEMYAGSHTYVEQPKPPMPTPEELREIMQEVVQETLGPEFVVSKKRTTKARKTRSTKRNRK